MSGLHWQSRPACVDVRDATTWTLCRDTIAGIGDVSTVWNPVPFGPYGGGTPHHYETLVIQPDGLGDSRTYVTEDEARDGHARMVAALRTFAELTR